MTAEQILYLLPYIASALVTLGICVYAWSHRNVGGARFYAWATLGQSLTTVAYCLELASGTLPTARFWDDVQWLTFFIVAQSLMAFSLHFTEKVRQPTLRLWVVLMLFPVIFMGLVITNGEHGLVRGESSFVAGSPFPVHTYALTPVAKLGGIYLIALALAAIGLLIGRFFRVPRLYKAQLLTVILGIAVPVVGGLLTLGGVTLSNQRDFTPVTFAISNLIVAWGLFRYRLFEVAPIARATVFENMSEAVFVVDLNIFIVDLNFVAQSMARRLGHAGNVIGKSLYSVFTEWTTKIDQFRYITTPVELEVSVASSMGDRSYLVSIAPIYVRGGYVGGYAILVKDITEQKQVSDQLRQQNEALEIARQRAEHADQLKTQFLASVSHELRTPLNAIINFNQFVSSGLFGEVNAKQVDTLEKSTDSARHLLSLINDILDMSKIGAGYLELDIEDDVDLHPELDSVISSVQTLLQSKAVKLLVDLPNPMPYLSVDRRRLKQVLLNLLSNAAKFTETGYIKLSLQDQHENILFAVEDTGPGIPLNAQDEIFEPFQQVKHPGQNFGGTGLGLPISRRLIEAHGGKLWLDSTPGVGSTFYITLPNRKPIEMVGNHAS